jgi:hypothetical protein
MKNFKPHFKFNKQERSGIFFLLLFLVAVQIGYFIYDTNKSKGVDLLVVDAYMQKKIDSLKQQGKK